MKKNSKQVLPTVIDKNAQEKKTAADMLEKYKAKQHIGRTKKDKESLELQKLLAARSAHLPGYSWCSDWIQWMRNNHPLLSICLKYRENPVGIGQRLIILLGSISFGLAATNIVYLFYRLYEDANGIVFRIETGDDISGRSVFVLTYEMVSLWTLGSLLHSLLDLGAWHVTACACCMPGACCQCCGWLRKLGPYISIALSGSFVAIATTAIVMRANFEASEGTNSLNELTGLNTRVTSFSFLGGYFIELGLVYFVYFPMIATVFFSGAVWSCIPCIGGRPKEIQRQTVEKRRIRESDDTFDDSPYA